MPEAGQGGSLVSVIVPSHNGRGWLARCLPRIGLHVSVPYEIVVASFSSLKPAATASTAHTLVRISPPTPASDVTDAINRCSSA